MEASHLCKFHIGASPTSVQVSSLCKSHICASFTSVQVSHRCKSHICASFTSVQVLHRCKFHICASLTSGQVSHLSKNLIFVQVLLHAHACTFLEHSCILGYLGPNRTEHVNQSHIFPILSLVLSDHQENENQKLALDLSELTFQRGDLVREEVDLQPTTAGADQITRGKPMLPS